MFGRFLLGLHHAQEQNQSQNMWFRDLAEGLENLASLHLGNAFLLFIVYEVGVRSTMESTRKDRPILQHNVEIGDILTKFHNNRKRWKSLSWLGMVLTSRFSTLCLWGLPPVLLQME